jgi:hypothetical protein
MHDYSGDAAHHAVRFVKHTELAEEGGAVVVRSLAKQAIVIIEGEDPAERKFDAPPGRREPSPRAEMSATNDDLHDYGVIPHMTALDVEVQFRKGV